MASGGPPYPEGYQKHIVGKYREAGWKVERVNGLEVATCGCPARHRTFIRGGNLTSQYVTFKLDWLNTETCSAWTGASE